jgi:citronellyl-CoA dehydrogenase
MVKLFSYREAQRAIELCLQLHGGLGYMGDHWTSRWYRDARALTIAAGTPEVMRDLIAAHLRLSPQPSADSPQPKFSAS